MHAPPTRTEALVVGDLPASLLDAFGAVGVELIPLRSGAALAECWRPGVLILWSCGRDWDGALGVVEALEPETQRAHCVLAGEDPPADIGLRVREIGALSWIRLPPPAWVVDTVLDAIDRSPASHLEDLARLRELQSTIDDDPRRVLLRLATVAGELFGSDLAMVTMEGGVPPEVRVLHEDEEGGVVLRRWRDRPGQPSPTIGLLQHAVRFGSVVVIPAVSASRLCEPLPPEPRYEAAIAVPVRTPLDDMLYHRLYGRGELVAVINLFWRQPRLPTVAEFRLIEVLGTLGTSVLTRLAERIRASANRREGTQALARLLHADYGWSADAVEEVMSRLVRGRLHAYASAPPASALWARVSTTSRQRSVWVTWGVPEPTGEPEVPPDVFGNPGWAADAEPIDYGSGESALITPVGNPALPAGHVVAVYERRADARIAREELRSLSAELDLGLRIARGAAVHQALVRIAHELAGSTAPAGALSAVMQVVRELMSSDGAKVYVVVQVAGEARLRQLHRTDGAPSELCILSDERGLGDWVIRNNDWLLVSQGVASGRVGRDPEVCLSGVHGFQRVMARPRADYGVPGTDDEQVMLLVPLATRGEVAGALAVWRDTPSPYDPDADVTSMLQLAPHIASACERVLQLEKAEEEFHATSGLGKLLRPDASIRDVERAVARRAGQLANAAAALLLWHDDAHPGRLHRGALWHGDDGMGDDLVELLRGCCEDLGRDARRWRDQVASLFTARLPPGTLRVRVVLALSPGTDGRPQGLLVVLDRAAPPTPTFGLMVAEQAARTWLEHASTVLENHLRAHASALVEKLTSGDTDGDDVEPPAPVPSVAPATADPRSEAPNPASVLETAASLLRHATGADLVLAWQGDAERLGLAAQSPHHPDVPVAVAHPTCPTVDPVVLVDARFGPGEPGRGERLGGLLGAIVAWLRWTRVRSAVWCPLTLPGTRHAYGALLVLTHDRGAFLGVRQAEVIRSFARRTAGELQKATRRAMLEDLRAMAVRLAAGAGAELGRLIVHEFEPWADRYVRSGVMVAVYARGTNDQELVFAASERLRADVVEKLRAVSVGLHTRSRRWSSWTLLKQDHQLLPLGLAGMACPVSLPGHTELGGHLMVLDPADFTAEQEAVLQDAARQVAIPLDSDRRRMDYTLKAGLFRHALLGPVQGVTDAALTLAKLATRGELTPEDARRLATDIRMETETIRTWRETQRLQGGLGGTGLVETRPRVQPLRPVVQRCVHRFEPLAAERGITLTEQWGEAGSLDFAFDAAALDLALSNLLHNAVKYAYYNREITVGVAKKGDMVQIWVEDVGHPIPAHVQEELYQLGRRAATHDPLRAIPGEGLGLFMARSVVESHGGRIAHSCRMEGGRDAGDRTPYRVRFTMELPHNWKRR